ncbi:MAG: porin PorA family protein, partial [Nocardioides sp.]
EIPPTEVDEVTVPAAFMGIDSVRRVRVQQVYSGGRTMWVEPNTGGFLDLRQHVRQELVGLGRAAGHRTVAMDASFALTAESRADAVDQWGQGAHLGRMHRTYPVVLGALGILVLALAAGLRRRRTPTG